MHSIVVIYKYAGEDSLRACFVSAGPRRLKLVGVHRAAVQRARLHQLVQFRGLEL